MRWLTINFNEVPKAIWNTVDNSASALLSTIVYLEERHPGYIYHSVIMETKVIIMVKVNHIQIFGQSFYGISK